MTFPTTFSHPSLRNLRGSKWRRKSIVVRFRTLRLPAIITDECALGRRFRSGGSVNMGLRVSIVVVVLSLFSSVTRGADGAGEVPEAFTPFEYLIGSWKGSGVPSANRVRGWSETHAWAWRFEKGKPVGLTVTMTGDKILALGKLDFDAPSKIYRLEGTDAEKKPILFTGTLDKAGKKLTLDRDGKASDGSRQQVTLYPNSNLVRYTVLVSEKEPGAPQYKKTIEVGLTKEGESFAAGSSVTDLPKCIVTGGSATLTVTYQGQSFPLCCSGCKAEFDENPEKYVKKAAMRAAGTSSKTAAKPAASVGKDDGSFDEPTTRKEAPAVSENKKSEPKGSTKKDQVRKATGDPEEKAASLLKLGQNLEKAGKSSAALGYYRQIAKDYSKTTAAKTASDRIKALSQD